jgi:predicted enzyme related to lactoylglutathione lyase
MNGVKGCRLVAVNLGAVDLDRDVAFDARALAAGAIEHFPPRDEPGLPRHSRFADPSGNRIVLWQG